jgi:hypothetical protein
MSFCESIISLIEHGDEGVITLIQGADFVLLYALFWVVAEHDLLTISRIAHLVDWPRSPFTRLRLRRRPACILSCANES